MSIPEAINYFFSAGQRLILKVVVPVWVILCTAVGLPASLLFAFVDICRIKGTAAACGIAGLRERIRALRTPEPVDDENGAEPETATPVAVEPVVASV